MGLTMITLHTTNVRLSETLQAVLLDDPAIAGIAYDGSDLIEVEHSTLREWLGVNGFTEDVTHHDETGIYFTEPAKAVPVDVDLIRSFVNDLRTSDEEMLVRDYEYDECEPFYGALDDVDTVAMDSWLFENGYEGSFQYLDHGAFSLVFEIVGTGQILKVSTLQSDTAPLYWQFCLGREETYLPAITALGNEGEYRWCVQPLYSVYRSDAGVGEVIRRYFDDYGTAHGLARALFPKVLEWIEANGLVLDLHWGNLALDASGNLIALDPTSYQY